MKRLSLFVLALLTIADTFTIQAQEKAVQDALYIFRNDGGFHAFFYSDIDHFEYSKIDTLGVEQADYCVQEIYALDSVFRIPISAIDSVAFVTPETKYNAAAVRPDKSLLSYIIASDSMTWFRVKAETPATLMPKVGDKLLIENTCELLPYGFAAKVSALKNETGGITIETEPIELTEVFDRFVWKFDTRKYSGTNETRRRANDADLIYPIILGDKGSYSFTGAKELDKQKLGPWADKLPALEAALAVDGTGTLSYDVEGNFNLTAFCHIDRGLNFDGYLKGHLKGEFNIAAQATISETFSQQLKKRSLGASLGGAEVAIGVFCQLSGAIGGSHDIKLAADVNGEAYAKNIHGYEDFSELWEKTNAKVSRKITEMSYTPGLNVSKVSLAVGAYVETEARFLGKSVTIRLEEGHSVGCDAEMNLSDFGTPDVITPNSNYNSYSSKLYDFLNRDFTLSYYHFVNGQMTFKLTSSINITPKKEIPIPFSQISITGGFVPKVEGTAFQRDKVYQYEGLATTQLSRKRLFGPLQKVGIGYKIIDPQKNVLEDYWAPNYYSEEMKNYSHTLDMLDPDTIYTLIPQVRLWNVPLLTSDSIEVTLGPKKLEMETLVYAEEDESYKMLPFVTNIKDVTFTPRVDWLETEVFNMTESRELSVSWKELPADVQERRGCIDIVGKNQKGDVIWEDSIVVQQCISSPQVAGVFANGKLYCSSPSYRKGETTTLAPLAIASDMIPNSIKVTYDENMMHVQCYKVSEDEYENYVVEPGTMISFSIDDVEGMVTKGQGNLKNLYFDSHFDFSSGGDMMRSDVYHFNVTSPIPIIKKMTASAGNSEKEDDEGDDGLSDLAEMMGARWGVLFGLEQSKGLKISDFSFTKKEWVYKWDPDLRDDVFDHIDNHQFSLHNNPENYIQVVVLFK